MKNFAKLLEAKLEIAEKGGKGSGFFAQDGHAGRIGKVGGSTSTHRKSGLNTISSSEFIGYGNEKYNTRKPTEEEINRFTSYINKKPEKLRALLKGRWEKTKCFLEIDESGGTAHCSGTRITISSDYLDTEVGLHEFIHFMININNRVYRGMRRKYHPPFLFEHAKRYGDDVDTVLNEQMTLILTTFNKNRNEWIDSVRCIEYSRRGNKKLSINDAEDQIKSLEDFLKGVDVW